jgi:hypothetical protein
MGHQPIGRHEAELPVPDLRRNVAQVGPFRMHQDHEVVSIPFLVSQEHVLAVHGVDAGQVRLRILHRGNGRILAAPEGNPELREPRVHAIFHGGNYGGRR